MQKEQKQLAGFFPVGSAAPRVTEMAPLLAARGEHTCAHIHAIHTALVAALPPLVFHLVSDSITQWPSFSFARYEHKALCIERQDRARPRALS